MLRRAWCAPEARRRWRARGHEATKRGAQAAALRLRQLTVNNGQRERRRGLRGPARTRRWGYGRCHVGHDLHAVRSRCGSS